MNCTMMHGSTNIKLISVFPSYLVLYNTFGWNSIVKYSGIITDLFFFLPDAEKSPTEDK